MPESGILADPVFERKVRTAKVLQSGFVGDHRDASVGAAYNCWHAGFHQLAGHVLVTEVGCPSRTGMRSRRVLGGGYAWSGDGLPGVVVGGDEAGVGLHQPPEHRGGGLVLGVGGGLEVVGGPGCG